MELQRGEEGRREEGRGRGREVKKGGRVEMRKEGKSREEEVRDGGRQRRDEGWMRYDCVVFCISLQSQVP